VLTGTIFRVYNLMGQVVYQETPAGNRFSFNRQGLVDTANNASACSGARITGNPLKSLKLAHSASINDFVITFAL
jgi:hypothetical protein